MLAPHVDFYAGAHERVWVSGTRLDHYFQQKMRSLGSLQVRDVSIISERAYLEKHILEGRWKKPMTIKSTLTLALMFTTLLTVPAMTQEKKIKRSDLPPAVEKAVATQSQGATIKGFAIEKEKGQVFYEAELTVNGHSKDVLMDAKGVIVEVEEQVAIESLPAAIKDGLQAEAGKGKLLKVESLTKHEKLVAYEALVSTGGKRSEVQVGPDGKPLSHNE